MPAAVGHECVNRGARGYVGGRGAHVEAGVCQLLCRRIRVFLTQVGQQDVLASAHPPRGPRESWGSRLQP
jgi:hypothetical protein